MSIDNCKQCCRMVDTDEDGEFYYMTMESGKEIQTLGFCRVCREDIPEALVSTQNLISAAWATMPSSLRAELYTFKNDLEEKIGLIEIDEEAEVEPKATLFAGGRIQ